MGRYGMIQYFNFSQRVLCHFAFSLANNIPSQLQSDLRGLAAFCRGEQEDRWDRCSPGVGEGETTMDCHLTSLDITWHHLTSLDITSPRTVPFKCWLLWRWQSRSVLRQESLRQMLQSCSIKWTRTTQAAWFLHKWVCLKMSCTPKPNG